MGHRDSFFSYKDSFLKMGGLREIYTWGSNGSCYSAESSGLYCEPSSFDTPIIQHLVTV